MFNDPVLFHTSYRGLGTTMPNLTYIPRFIAPNVINPGAN